MTQPSWIPRWITWCFKCEKRVGGPSAVSFAEITTPLKESVRRLRQEGPREVDVTPEFVRALLRGQ